MHLYVSTRLLHGGFVSGRIGPVEKRMKDFGLAGAACEPRTARNEVERKTPVELDRYRGDSDTDAPVRDWGKVDVEASTCS